MKKAKTQKGITLVALIITIVVLLILAAVAIGTVRDSNIIGHAQNAANIYNQEVTNEQALLDKYESYIEKNNESNPWVQRGLTLVKIQYDKQYSGILTNDEGKSIEFKLTVESTGGFSAKYKHENGYEGISEATNEEVEAALNTEILVSENKLELVSSGFTCIFNDDGKSANITMRYDSTIFSGTITVSDGGMSETVQWGTYNGALLIYIGDSENVVLNSGTIEAETVTMNSDGSIGRTGEINEITVSNCMIIMNMSDKIKSIDFGGYLGRDAVVIFQNSTSLESVKGLGEITRLDDIAFDGCSNLKSIELPSTLTSVESAFENCSNLTDITIYKEEGSLNLTNSGLTQEQINNIKWVPNP